jgi:acetyl esterase/lipase
MRSRYTAYAREDGPYLLASWHSSTRPATLPFDASLRWTRLQVVETSGGGLLDTVGTVHFRAAHVRRGAVGGPRGAQPLQPRGRPLGLRRAGAVTTRLREAYGPHERHVGDWWVPDSAEERLPTVVLVHGGFWRPRWDLSLEDDVAADLAARGLLVWNVDYRPSSEPWPATLVDVAAAHDHLRTSARADLGRTAVVGHSAGGHLALWLASRGRLPAGAPGAGPRVAPPVLAVAQAPVADLREAARLGLGSGAVEALLGGAPADVPDRVAVADPLALLPTGVPTVCVHGEADDDVPIAQSEAYVARAGDAARLVRLPGGHLEHVDPASAAVSALRDALSGL